MNLTLENTVQCTEEYLQVLAALDQAEVDGELDFEWAAKPSATSHSAIAEHAIQHLHDGPEN